MWIELNYKKYLTAGLYSVQVPIGVWAGFEFGKENYPLGIGLTALMMLIEGLAVVTWMDAQTKEIKSRNDANEGPNL